MRDFLSILGNDADAVVDLDLSLAAGDSLTDVFNLGSVNADKPVGFSRTWAGGAPKYLEIVITEQPVSTGTTTIDFILETDGDVAWGSDVDLWNTGAISKATLVVGKKYRTAIPEAAEQYLRVKATLAGDTATAGLAQVSIVIE